MFNFAENETNCTHNFIQVWNDLVDYFTRSPGRTPTVVNGRLRRLTEVNEDRS